MNGAFFSLSRHLFLVCSSFARRKFVIWAKFQISTDFIWKFQNESKRSYMCNERKVDLQLGYKICAYLKFWPYQKVNFSLVSHGQTSDNSVNFHYKPTNFLSFHTEKFVHLRSPVFKCETLSTSFSVFGLLSKS